MKLSFSTAICPNSNWDEVLLLAENMEFEAVEIDGLSGQNDNLLCRPFRKEFRFTSGGELYQHYLTLSGINCSGYFKTDEAEAYCRRAKEHIDLAYELGIRFIRIHGADSGTEKHAELSLLAETIHELGEYAETKDIFLELESEGILAHSALLAKVLRQADQVRAGACWDLAQTCIIAGEDAEETYENLRPYLCNVRITDSREENGKRILTPIGDGELPIEKVIALLRHDGFPSYLTLVWPYSEKPAEPKLILKQYLQYMNELTKP